MNHHTTDTNNPKNVQDFWLTKDQRDVKKATDRVASQINNYSARLDDIFNAQLHTAEKITGQNADDYLLLKSTFDAFLTSMETLYSWRIQQFEDLHSDLVATASPETARKAMDIIVGHQEEQARHNTAFESLASELFQMEHDENYQSPLLEKED